MRRSLLTVLLASALLSVAMGEFFPSSKCSIVSEYQANNFITELFHSINNCKIATFRSLLTADFQQYVFDGVRSRDDIVGILRTLCGLPVPPRFVPRIIARQNSKSFIVEAKTFKGHTLLYTLNNNYTLRRRFYCPKKFKTCFQLVSSVNHLRVTDLEPFGVPQ